jgi:hypothetical protein
MKVLESLGGPVPKEFREGSTLLEPAFDVGSLLNTGASPPPPAYFASEGSEWAELLLLEKFGDLESRLPTERYDSLLPEFSESRDFV